MSDQQNHAECNRRFRVLALDGGGIKGTYTAAVLAGLETMTGKHLWQHFDLMTGTSTGGIIAVALGLGVSAYRILQLYVENGTEIFPGPHTRMAGQAGIAMASPRSPEALYQDVLKNAIEAVIGDRRFGESKVRLVVPAFDAVRGSVQLFKTSHAPEYKQDYLLPASTVALGTSAAPTFYPAHADAGGGCYLDGGVWANCPAMVGLIEATCILGRNIDQVDLLSIGTTSSPFDVSHVRRRGGVATWNSGVVDLFMQAQIEAALGQARLLTKGRMLRIDTITRPGRFSLDNSCEIDDLKSLGEQSARQHENEVLARFLHSLAPSFQPYYDLAAIVPEPPDAISGEISVVSLS